jgi:hypothetical protein
MLTQSVTQFILENFNVVDAASRRTSKKTGCVQNTCVWRPFEKHFVLLLESLSDKWLIQQNWTAAALRAIAADLRQAASDHEDTNVSNLLIADAPRGHVSLSCRWP